MRIDFHMEKAVPLSLRIRRAKDKCSRGFKVHLNNVRRGVSLVIPNFRDASAQISFLSGATHALIVYSAWFMWKIISPTTPSERLATFIVALGYWAILQFIILKATEAVGRSTQLDTTSNKKKKSPIQFI